MRNVLFLLFLASCAFSNNVRKISNDDKLPMEYKEICNPSGECRKFSRLIMGTDHLVQAGWQNENQKEISREKFNELLDEAVRLGINLFDTSPIYVGSVEKKLGEWQKSRTEMIKEEDFYYQKNLNPDRKIYTLSKGGFPFDLYYSKKIPEGENSEELLNFLKVNNYTSENMPTGTYASRLYGSSEQIKNRVLEEISNSSLQLNNEIAVYLMHRDDNDYVNFKKIPRKQTSVFDIMTSLSSKEIASKYFILGWSNWETDRINESLVLARKNKNFTNPFMNSAYFSLFEMGKKSIHAGGIQNTHSEMNDVNFQKGINQMSYSPLGGFSIFDKPTPIFENAKKDAKIKFDNGDAYWKNVYEAIFTIENEARFTRVQNFTAEFNLKHNTNYTIDQMINAYALAHKRADFLTIGPVNIEQLRRTVDSLKLSKKLTESDLDYLHHGN